MLKKTITYTDFNGDEQTETFYFNFTKAELLEMELSVDGGLAATLKNIVEAENIPRIMAEMKKFVMAAYGKRSDDGRRFIKNDQVREEFLSSEAYSDFFMELCTNAEVAAEFVNGIIPQSLIAEVQAMAEEQKKTETESEQKIAVLPVPEKNPEETT